MLNHTPVTRVRSLSAQIFLMRVITFLRSEEFDDREVLADLRARFALLITAKFPHDKCWMIIKLDLEIKVLWI